VTASLVAHVLLAVTGLCALVRLMVGPTLADRVVALDVALMALMGGVAVRAAASGDTSELNLLVVIAIVGFTATVAASRFIEHEEASR
jgi:multicomponent Na+:H+ antiporter subunit F